jgi:hypothetical protein
MALASAFGGTRFSLCGLGACKDQTTQAEACATKTFAETAVV